MLRSLLTALVSVSLLSASVASAQQVSSGSVSTAKIVELRRNITSSKQEVAQLLEQLNSVKFKKNVALTIAVGAGVLTTVATVLGGGQVLFGSMGTARSNDWAGAVKIFGPAIAATGSATAGSVWYFRLRSEEVGEVRERLAQAERELAGAEAALDALAPE